MVKSRVIGEKQKGDREQPGKIRFIMTVCSSLRWAGGELNRPLVFGDKLGV